MNECDRFDFCLKNSDFFPSMLVSSIVYFPGLKHDITFLSQRIYYGILTCVSVTYFKYVIIVYSYCIVHPYRS